MASLPSYPILLKASRGLKMLCHFVMSLIKAKVFNENQKNLLLKKK